MFLWRTDENYSSIIIKYPLYLFHWRYHPVARQANLCLWAFCMTNFNCACPAIQRGQGSGFLSEGSSWLTACMSEQWRFWRDCADAQADETARMRSLAWTIAARTDDKYQIRLMQPTLTEVIFFASFLNCHDKCALQIFIYSACFYNCNFHEVIILYFFVKIQVLLVLCL